MISKVLQTWASFDPSHVDSLNKSRHDVYRHFQAKHQLFHRVVVPTCIFISHDYSLLWNAVKQ